MQSTKCCVNGGLSKESLGVLNEHLLQEMLPISCADDTSESKAGIDWCLQGAGGIDKGLLKAQGTAAPRRCAGNNIIPAIPAPGSSMCRGAQPARGFPEIEMQTSLPFTNPVTLKEL